MARTYLTETVPEMKIALLQDRWRGCTGEAMDVTGRLVAEAASNGANIVCTQELFKTDYFCQRQDPELFELAESIPGAGTEELQGLAKRHGVALVASLFERRAPGLHHNTAVVIDADGTYLGAYRKMHIPQDPGFEEKYYFSPGDSGFRAWDTKFGRIGVIVCWDQWYPESARLTALQGANLILCPTAIGWLKGDPPEVRRTQRDSWIRVQQGHAVANACYYAAINRVGTEGGIEFWGSSFVCDFHGDMLCQGSADSTETLYADCDFKAMERRRRMWPFFRDRRIDAYEGITKRFDNDPS